MKGGRGFGYIKQQTKKNHTVVVTSSVELNQLTVSKMLHVLTGLKDLIRLDKVCIDNSIFKCHYKFTTAIMLIFCVLCTSRQFFGAPIECSIEGVPPNMGNLYCWITSTFTVPNRFGENAAHPGVSHFDPALDERNRHKYYQWTGLVLLFQALLFYLSHYVWKLCESGRIKSLTNDLNNYNPSILDAKINTLREHFYKNSFSHTSYYIRFVFCETFNLINVFLQMFLIDWFLNFEFSTYGWKVLTFTTQEQENRIDPMSLIFPKVAKCIFNKYGPSGSIETHDGLCVLPINVMNEKIYIFLWFWLLILTVLSFGAFIARLLTIFSARFRYFMFLANHAIANAEHVKYLSSTMRASDWFMLCQIAKNVDALVLKKLITDMVLGLQDKKKTPNPTASTSKANWNMDLKWEFERKKFDTCDIDTTKNV